MPSDGQRGATVKDTDVVEPEKTPFEEVPAKAILTIDPQAEIGHQPAKNPFQKLEVGLAS